MSLKRPMRVLLVDDNPADRDLIQETLEEGTTRVEIVAVGDGVEAMDYLAEHPGPKGGACPDLMILDLNLPRLDGWGVLRAVKGDPKLRALPIVVLTSSNAEADVRQCYDLGANSYLAKPMGLAEFRSVVHKVEEFWLETAKLP